MDGAAQPSMQHGHQEVSRLAEKAGEFATTAWGLVMYYLQPLERFFREESVTEICVNRYDQVYVERAGQFTLEKDARWDSEITLVTCIEQIANALGQEVHAERRPLLDARLPDGSRINAVLSPVAHGGSNMTIRLFPKASFTAMDLLKREVYTKEMLEFLHLAMACHYNMLISGGTGSGKTTLLNIIANFVSDEDRVVTIEDTAELKINKPHVVGLEAAKRSIKQADPVNMAALLKNVLRMRPERIFVGEVRDGEAATALLQAINTGHRGVLSTLHANSAVDALDRLDVLIASADSRIPFDSVCKQVRANFDAVVQVARTPIHGRRVLEIMELQDGKPVVLYRWNFQKACHERVPGTSSRVSELAARYGIKIPEHLRSLGESHAPQQGHVQHAAHAAHGALGHGHA